MPSVDIKVPDELREVLEVPKCLDLKFPEPQKLKITTPMGSTIPALQDAGKAIPNDCSLTFSLLVQLGPLMASMDCLVKVLKLIKPLIDIVNGLPVPPFKAIKEFGEAAVDLAPCLLIPTPANMIPFVRDLLCLIIKVLNCLVGQLETLAEVMGGLALQLEDARAKKNQDLIETLECAQGNAATSAAHLFQSFEPIKALLDLAGPFMSIAGVQAIQLPGVGDSSSQEGVQETITAIKSVIDTMQTIVDGLGGCD